MAAISSSVGTASAASAPVAGGEGAATPLKIYISVDIEGVGNVVNDAHLAPGGLEYEQARQWMTDEAAVAAQAALDAGATEVLMSDSHGNGINLIPERLPTGVRLVRSWPRANAMMCGVDKSFAGAMLVGYHPGTHSLSGVRAHTMSSALLTGISLNGQLVSEAGTMLALATFSVSLACMATIHNDLGCVLSASDTCSNHQSSPPRQPLATAFPLSWQAGTTYYVPI